MQMVEQQSQVPPTSPSGDVITVRSLSKSFKGRLAVNNVSFNVQPGDVFGLLGPNGAGKTTIIRMLLGLIKPTGGEAQVFGANPTTQRDRVLARTSSIIEAPALYPNLNGFDNLKVMGYAAGVDDDAKIREVLDRIGMLSRATGRYKTYSLGMKQRMCIAAALLTDPQLLILDEPTNGLDPAGMHDIRGLIRQLASEGCTIMLSSHLLNEVQQVCNRIAIINFGSVIVSGLVEDLLASKKYIKVRVAQSDWEKAWFALHGQGYGERLRAEGQYLILDVQDTEGAAINQALAGQGIWASEITPASQSLEDYYLTLTQQAPPQPGMMPGVMPGQPPTPPYPQFPGQPPMPPQGNSYGR